MIITRSVEDSRQSARSSLAQPMRHCLGRAWEALRPHNLKLLHSNRFEIPQTGAVGHVKGHKTVRSGANT
jgi:hypothetical protein